MDIRVEDASWFSDADSSDGSADDAHRRSRSQVAVGQSGPRDAASLEQSAEQHGFLEIEHTQGRVSAAHEPISHSRGRAVSSATRAAGVIGLAAEGARGEWESAATTSKGLPSGRRPDYQNSGKVKRATRYHKAAAVFRRPSPDEVASAAATDGSPGRSTSATELQRNLQLRLVFEGGIRPSRHPVGSKALTATSGRRSGTARLPSRAQEDSAAAAAIASARRTPARRLQSGDGPASSQGGLANVATSEQRARSCHKLGSHPTQAGDLEGQRHPGAEAKQVHSNCLVDDTKKSPTRQPDTAPARSVHPPSRVLVRARRRDGGRERRPGEVDARLYGEAASTRSTGVGTGLDAMVDGISVRMSERPARAWKHASSPHASRSDARRDASALSSKRHEQRPGHAGHGRGSVPPEAHGARQPHRPGQDRSVRPRPPTGHRTALRTRPKSATAAVTSDPSKARSKGSWSRPVRPGSAGLVRGRVRLLDGGAHQFGPEDLAEARLQPRQYIGAKPGITSLAADGHGRYVGKQRRPSTERPSSAPAIDKSSRLGVRDRAVPTLDAVLAASRKAERRVDKETSKRDLPARPATAPFARRTGATTSTVAGVDACPDAAHRSWVGRHSFVPQTPVAPSATHFQRRRSAGSSSGRVNGVPPRSKPASAGTRRAFGAREGATSAPYSSYGAAAGSFSEFVEERKLDAHAHESTPAYDHPAPQGPEVSTAVEQLELAAPSAALAERVGRAYAEGLGTGAESHEGEDLRGSPSRRADVSVVCLVDADAVLSADEKDRRDSPPVDCTSDRWDVAGGGWSGNREDTELLHEVSQCGSLRLLRGASKELLPDSVLHAELPWMRKDGGEGGPFQWIPILRSDARQKRSVYLRSRCRVEPFSRYNPYALQVVPMSQVPADDFWTMDAAELRHVTPEGMTTQRLDDWIVEHRQFHEVQRIPFFRYFPQWKVLQLLRRIVRQRKMARAALSMLRRVPLLQPGLQASLLEVREMCENLKRQSLFYIPGEERTWAFELSQWEDGAARAVTSSGPKVARDAATEDRIFGVEAKRLGTFTIEDFRVAQDSYADDLSSVFAAFGNAVRSVALRACEAAVENAVEVRPDFQDLRSFLKRVEFQHVGDDRDTSDVWGVVDVGHLHDGDGDFADDGASVTNCVGISTKDRLEGTMPYTTAASKRAAGARLHRYLSVLQFLVTDTLSDIVVTNTAWLWRRMEWSQPPQPLVSLDAFEAAFRAVDVDGSGSLDRDEVHEMMRMIYRGKLSAEEIEAEAGRFLDVFDADGDGEVTWEELDGKIASAAAARTATGATRHSDTDATEKFDSLTEQMMSVMQQRQEQPPAVVHDEADSEMTAPHGAGTPLFVMELRLLPPTYEMTFRPTAAQWGTALRDAIDRFFDIVSYVDVIRGHRVFASLVSSAVRAEDAAGYPVPDVLDPPLALNRGEYGHSSPFAVAWLAGMAELVDAAAKGSAEGSFKTRLSRRLRPAVEEHAQVYAEVTDEDIVKRMTGKWQTTTPKEPLGRLIMLAAVGVRVVARCICNAPRAAGDAQLADLSRTDGHKFHIARSRVRHRWLAALDTFSVRYDSARKLIDDYFTRAYNTCVEYVTAFDDLRKEFVRYKDWTVDATRTAVLKGDLTLSDLTAYLRQFRSTSQTVARLLESNDVAIVRISLRPLKEFLLPVWQGCTTQIENLIPMVAHEKIKSLLADYREWIDVLSSEAGGLSQYAKQLARLEWISTHRGLLAERQVEIDSYTSAVNQFALVSHPESSTKLSELLDAKKALDSLVKEWQQRRYDEAPQFQHEIDLRGGALVGFTSAALKIAMCASNSKGRSGETSGGTKTPSRSSQPQSEQQRALEGLLPSFTGDEVLESSPTTVARKLLAAVHGVREALAEADELSDTQQLLNRMRSERRPRPVSDWTLLRQVEAAVLFSQRVWGCLAAWTGFEEECLVWGLDSFPVAAASNTANAFFQAAVSASKRVSRHSALTTLLQRVKDFRSAIPVVASLQNRHLMPRHWVALANSVGGGFVVAASVAVDAAMAAIKGEKEEKKETARYEGEESDDPDGNAAAHGLVSASDRDKRRASVVSVVQRDVTMLSLDSLVDRFPSLPGLEFDISAMAACLDEAGDRLSTAKFADIGFVVTKEPAANQDDGDDMSDSHSVTSPVADESTKPDTLDHTNLTGVLANTAGEYVMTPSSVVRQAAAKVLHETAQREGASIAHTHPEGQTDRPRDSTSDGASVDSGTMDDAVELSCDGEIDRALNPDSAGQVDLDSKGTSSMGDLLESSDGKGTEDEATVDILAGIDDVQDVTDDIQSDEGAEGAGLHAPFVQSDSDDSTPAAAAESMPDSPTRPVELPRNSKPETFRAVGLGSFWLSSKRLVQRAKTAVLRAEAHVDLPQLAVHNESPVVASAAYEAALGHLSVRQVLDPEILQHAAFVVALSGAASREWVAMQRISSVMAKWRTREVPVVPGESSNYGVPLLQDTQGLEDELEASLVELQAIAADIDMAPVQKSLFRSRDELRQTQQTLRRWAAVQDAWRSTAILLNAPGTVVQAPTAATVFRSLDSEWRRTMHAVLDFPTLLYCGTASQVQYTLSLFEESGEELTAAIAELLQKRRDGCARLYFLSDRQLTDLLCRVSREGPAGSLSYIPLLFPFDSVAFEADDAEDISSSGQQLIVSVSTADGEDLQLGHHLHARGHVDQFIPKLAGRVRAVLRKQSQQLLGNDSAPPMATWPKLTAKGDVASQLCLAGVRLQWSRKMEGIAARERPDPASALVAVREWCSTSATLMAPRPQENGRHPRKQLQTAAAMACQLLACRDTTATIQSEVSATGSSPVWSMLPRTTWSTVAGGGLTVTLGDDSDSSSLSVRQYGYEFRGLDRIIVTPATLKAQVAMSRSLREQQGSLLIGGHGTGKTACVSSLVTMCGAHMHAVPSGVASSPGAVLRLVIGSVASGSWLCIQAFDQLPLEVASVFTQLLSTVRQAYLMRSKTAYLGGIEVKLSDSSQAVFNATVSDRSDAWMLPAASYKGTSAMFTELRPTMCEFPDVEMFSKLLAMKGGADLRSASAVALLISRCVAVLHTVPTDTGSSKPKAGRPCESSSDIALPLLRDSIGTGVKLAVHVLTAATAARGTLCGAQPRDLVRFCAAVVKEYAVPLVSGEAAATRELLLRAEEEVTSLVCAGDCDPIVPGEDSGNSSGGRASPLGEEETASASAPAGSPQSIAPLSSWELAESAMRKRLHVTTTEMKLAWSHEQLERAQQLHDSLSCRKIAVLVGAAGCGKSTLWQATALALAIEAMDGCLDVLSDEELAVTDDLTTRVEAATISPAAAPDSSHWMPASWEGRRATAAGIGAEGVGILGRALRWLVSDCRNSGDTGTGAAGAAEDYFGKAGGAMEADSARSSRWLIAEGRLSAHWVDETVCMLMHMSHGEWWGDVEGDGTLKFVGEDLDRTDDPPPAIGPHSLILETCSLEDASPSLLEHAAIVHVKAAPLAWHQIIVVYLDTSPQVARFPLECRTALRELLLAEGHVDAVLRAVGVLLSPTPALSKEAESAVELESVGRAVGSAQESAAIVAVQSMCAIIEATLSSLESRVDVNEIIMIAAATDTNASRRKSIIALQEEQQRNRVRKQQVGYVTVDEMVAQMRAVVVHALSWGLVPHGNREGATKADHTLRFRFRDDPLPAPSQGLLHEFGVHPKTGRLVPWRSISSLPLFVSPPLWLIGGRQHPLAKIDRFARGSSGFSGSKVARPWGGPGFFLCSWGTFRSDTGVGLVLDNETPEAVLRARDSRSGRRASIAERHVEDAAPTVSLDEGEGTQELFLPPGLSLDSRDALGLILPAERLEAPLSNRQLSAARVRLQAYIRDRAGSDAAARLFPVSQPPDVETPESTRVESPTLSTERGVTASNNVLFIPPSDEIALRRVAGTLAHVGRHVMLAGAPGVGKSLLCERVVNALRRDLSRHGEGYRRGKRADKPYSWRGRSYSVSTTIRTYLERGFGYTGAPGMIERRYSSSGAPAVTLTSSSDGSEKLHPEVAARIAALQAAVHPNDVRVTPARIHLPSVATADSGLDTPPPGDWQPVTNAAAPTMASAHARRRARASRPRSVAAEAGLDSSIRFAMAQHSETLTAARPGRQVVVFVDDISLNTPTQYREAVRALVDRGQLFDREHQCWNEVQQATLLATLGREGAASSLSQLDFQRLLHHFSVLEARTNSESVRSVLHTRVKAWLDASPIRIERLGYSGSVTMDLSHENVAFSIASATVRLLDQLSSRCAGPAVAFTLHDARRILLALERSMPARVVTGATLPMFWATIARDVAMSRFLRVADAAVITEELETALERSFQLPHAQTIAWTAAMQRGAVLARDGGRDGSESASSGDDDGEGSESLSDGSDPEGARTRQRRRQRAELRRERERLQVARKLVQPEEVAGLLRNTAVPYAFSVLSALPDVFTHSRSWAYHRAHEILEVGARGEITSIRPGVMRSIKLAAAAVYVTRAMQSLAQTRKEAAATRLQAVFRGLRDRRTLHATQPRRRSRSTSARKRRQSSRQQHRRQSSSSRLANDSDEALPRVVHFVPLLQAAVAREAKTRWLPAPASLWGWVWTHSVPVFERICGEAGEKSIHGVKRSIGGYIAALQAAWSQYDAGTAAAAAHEKPSAEPAEAQLWMRLQGRATHGARGTTLRVAMGSLSQQIDAADNICSPVRGVVFSVPFVRRITALANTLLSNTRSAAFLQASPASKTGRRGQAERNFGVRARQEVVPAHPVMPGSSAPLPAHAVIYGGVGTGKLTVVTAMCAIHGFDYFSIDAAGCAPVESHVRPATDFSWILDDLVEQSVTSPAVGETGQTNSDDGAHGAHGGVMSNSVRARFRKAVSMKLPAARIASLAHTSPAKPPGKRSPQRASGSTAKQQSKTAHSFPPNTRKKDMPWRNVVHLACARAALGELDVVLFVRHMERAPKALRDALQVLISGEGIDTLFSALEYNALLVALAGAIYGDGATANIASKELQSAVQRLRTSVASKLLKAAKATKEFRKSLARRVRAKELMTRQALAEGRMPVEPTASSATTGSSSPAASPTARAGVVDDALPSNDAMTPKERKELGQLLAVLVRKHLRVVLAVTQEDRVVRVRDQLDGAGASDRIMEAHQRGNLSDALSSTGGMDPLRSTICGESDQGGPGATARTPLDHLVSACPILPLRCSLQWFSDWEDDEIRWLASAFLDLNPLQLAGLLRAVVGGVEAALQLASEHQAEVRQRRDSSASISTAVDSVISHVSDDEANAEDRPATGRRLSASRPRGSLPLSSLISDEKSNTFLGLQEYVELARELDVLLGKSINRFQTLQSLFSRLFADLHGAAERWSNDAAVQAGSGLELPEEAPQSSPVTPGHLHELMPHFLRVLFAARTTLENEQGLLEQALNAFETAKEKVAELREEAAAMRKRLAESKTVQEDMRKRISGDEKRLLQMMEAVERDRQTFARQTEITEELARTAAAELAEVAPLLEEAERAVGALDKLDLAEIKSFPKPPDLVRLVMEAVCILLGAPPTWASAKKVLAQQDFILSLVKYDKEHVADDVLVRLQRYVKHPSFVPDQVGRHSVACMSLCQWVRAIAVYARVYREVAPLRRRLEAAEALLASYRADLSLREADLASLQHDLNLVRARLREEEELQARLEREIDETTRRAAAATRRFLALSQERGRWSYELRRCALRRSALVGDAMLTAASSVYLPCIAPSHWSLLADDWAKLIGGNGLFVSDWHSLPAAVFSPLATYMAEADGEPTDFHTQTATALLVVSLRPRLVVDPLGVGLSALRRLEGPQGLREIPAPAGSQGSALRFQHEVTRCVRDGVPLLVRDVSVDGAAFTSEVADAVALAKKALAEHLSRLDEDADRAEQVRGAHAKPVGQGTAEYTGFAHLATNAGFSLYLHTSVAKPALVPALLRDVAIIDFTPTRHNWCSSVVTSAWSLLLRQSPDLTTDGTLPDEEDPCLSAAQLELTELAGSACEALKAKARSDTELKKLLSTLGDPFGVNSAHSSTDKETLTDFREFSLVSAAQQTFRGRVRRLRELERQIADVRTVSETALAVELERLNAARAASLRRFAGMITLRSGGVRGGSMFSSAAHKFRSARTRRSPRHNLDRTDTAVTSDDSPHESKPALPWSLITREAEAAVPDEADNEASAKTPEAVPFPLKRVTERLCSWLPAISTSWRLYQFFCDWLIKAPTDVRMYQVSPARLRCVIHGWIAQTFEAGTDAAGTHLPSPRAAATPSHMSGTHASLWAALREGDSVTPEIRIDASARVILSETAPPAVRRALRFARFVLQPPKAPSVLARSVCATVLRNILPGVSSSDVPALLCAVAAFLTADEPELWHVDKWKLWLSTDLQREPPLQEGLDARAVGRLLVRLLGQFVAEWLPTAMHPIDRDTGAALIDAAAALHSRRELGATLPAPERDRMVDFLRWNGDGSWALSSAYSRSSGSVAMLLLCPGQVDVVGAVCRLAEQRFGTRAPVKTFGLATNRSDQHATDIHMLISEVRSMIFHAVRNGGWVVLLDAHLAAPAVHDAVEQVMREVAALMTTGSRAETPRVRVPRRRLGSGSRSATAKKTARQGGSADGVDAYKDAARLALPPREVLRGTWLAAHDGLGVPRVDRWQRLSESPRASYATTGGRTAGRDDAERAGRASPLSSSLRSRSRRAGISTLGGASDSVAFAAEPSSGRNVSRYDASAVDFYQSSVHPSFVVIIATRPGAPLPSSLVQRCVSVAVSDAT